jgi:hypothetical protein
MRCRKRKHDYIGNTAPRHVRVNFAVVCAETEEPLPKGSKAVFDPTTQQYYSMSSLFAKALKTVKYSHTRTLLSRFSWKD